MRGFWLILAVEGKNSPLFFSVCVSLFYFYGKSTAMKHALVTGAGRGIGRTVTEKLASEGYHVVAVSRTREELSDWPFPERVHGFVADITDASQRQELYQFCLTQNRLPHVLVNNAGLYSQDKVTGEPSILEDSLRINLIQVRELTSLFWEPMATAKNTHVFNIISVLGREIRAEAASYTIAKHALAAYNKLLVHDGKARGIKVTGIFPASVYTSAWAGTGVNPDLLITPQDVAALLLASLALSPAAVPEEIHLGCMTPGF
jgi:short-subunit dehydrogenase